MKVFIYATAAQGAQEGAAYEEAINHVRKDDEVLFVHCDRIMMGCHSENPCFKPLRCKICESLQKTRARKYLPQQVKYKAVSDFLTDDITATVDNCKLNYENATDLRGLEYKGVRIGYGALSTFITQTRNLEPQMTDKDRFRLDNLLRQQVLLTELTLRILNKYNPDLVYIHNGRLADYRPVLELCQIKGIEFITTESLKDANDIYYKDYFLNTTPHNSIACAKKYNEFWDMVPEEERITVGESFFINRKFGKYAGDEIYTRRQIIGKMPDNWQKGKRHIVIFNSSEDEFAAINEEVDKAALFKSQLYGINTIVKKYANRDDWQLFLRIHPNLNNVKYDYHKKLYEIAAPNFTVIPSDSDISSYALMDAADLVIVFGSTTGLESVYWGKPVICLAYAFYGHLNVVYAPKTEDELWNLVEDVHLPAKPNDNCLKYGLYYMSTRLDKFDNLNIKQDSYKIFGKTIKEMNYLKLFGSSLLYYFAKKLMNKIFVN